MAQVASSSAEGPRVYPARLEGVDALRGLAVLGMFAAHVGNDGTMYPTGGWPWLWVFHGRSAAVFAFLAGLSIALLDKPGSSAAYSRMRIGVRAGILIVLGVWLNTLHTAVVVILVNTGLMMLLGMIAMRWRTRWLAAGSASVALVGPWIWMRIWPEHFPVGTIGTPFVGDLTSAVAGKYYPVIVWMAYVLAGLCIGRLDLRDGKVLARLAVVGGVLALGAGWSGWALHGGKPWHALAGPGTATTSDGGTVVSVATGDAGLGGALNEWASISPHSNSTFEVLSNLGVCLLLLAVFLAIASRWRRVLLPLSAVGAMALTAYTGQLIAIWGMRTDVVGAPKNATLVVFWLVAIGFALLWRFTVGRGPMEQLLHEASTRIARRLAGQRVGGHR